MFANKLLERIEEYVAEEVVKVDQVIDCIVLQLYNSTFLRLNVYENYRVFFLTGTPLNF